MNQIFIRHILLTRVLENFENYANAKKLDKVG